jgi:hypothetical protein
MYIVLRAYSARLRRIIVCTAILPLGLMGVSLAQADNCTGYDVGVAQSVETSDLGQGLKQTVVRASSVVLSNDSIYNMATGECSNVTLQTPDGKNQYMGYCARRDKNGDTYGVAIRLAPGADKGEWKSTGGTGKFADKQDSGWAQVALTDGKIIVVKWGGNCH